jgi:hypothetical protein
LVRVWQTHAGRSETLLFVWDVDLRGLVFLGNEVRPRGRPSTTARLAHAPTYR